MARKRGGEGGAGGVRLCDLLGIADLCRVERDLGEGAVHSMVAAYGGALDRVEGPTRLTEMKIRGESVGLRPGLRERYQRLSVSLLS